MAKYKRKPTTIEAIQWWPGMIVNGVEEFYDPNPTDRNQPYPVVFTVNGPVKIEPGEWIITGINGETYPCKDEIFKKTYELVE